MTIRFVLAAVRAGGQISALVNPGAAWSPRSTKDVIEDITQKGHKYVVFVPPFNTAIVTVVRVGSDSFLRTASDHELSNNLGRLPDGQAIPRQFPVRVRKNAADLTQDERTRFVAAINELCVLKVPNDPDRVNWWFKWDQIHRHFGSHSDPRFLPWHRVLVNEFEKALQMIDPEITVPYWDWTTDPRRTPDRNGQSVNLMTPEFMGSDTDEIGPPFTTLYKPGVKPNRDSPDSDLIPPFKQVALPPSVVSRQMPKGKGPREADTKDMWWADWGGPPNASPWIPDDRGTLWDGYGSVQKSYSDMTEDVTVAHGWAHRFVGRDIAYREFHYAFRDPFVFLIHANVDRLYASWQLRQMGNPAESAWRLDPTKIYGDDLAELQAPMDPWSGGAQGITPWVGPLPPVLPTSSAVVRPALYDKYVYDDEVDFGPVGGERMTCSWPALLLGRRLAHGDRIKATIEYDVAVPGSVEVQLKLGSSVRLWKSVMFVDLATALFPFDLNALLAGGLAAISAEHDQREASMRVPTTKLPTARLLFIGASDPSAVAARELQYQLGDLEFLPDRSRLVLNWVAD